MTSLAEDILRKIVEKADSDGWFDPELGGVDVGMIDFTEDEITYIKTMQAEVARGSGQA